MITFEQMRDVLIPAGRELLLENMNMTAQRMRERLFWFLPVFGTKQTSDWTNQISSFFNARPWPEWDEQQPIPKTKWEDVDRTEVDLSEYMDSFSLTDRYLTFGDPKQALDYTIPKLADFLENFVMAGLMQHTLKAANVFFDAFAGNTFTGLDGFPLCYHNHTGGFSNLLSLDLDEAALQTAWELRMHITDDNANVLPIMPDTLLVGPKNKINAFELVSNSVKPGAMNSEKNFWQGAIKNVVECPYFDSAQQGAPAYADDMWFLIDSGANTLRYFLNEMPRLLDRVTISPVEMTIVGRTRMAFGWHSWEGVIGSKGTET